MKKALFAILFLSAFLTAASGQDGRIIQRKVSVIDFKNKENLIFFSPKTNLGVILYQAVTDGRQNQKVKAFADSALSIAMSIEEIRMSGSYYDTITVYPDPGDDISSYDTVLFNPYNPMTVKKFLIIEDSMADLSGQGFNKIIALAPIYEKTIHEVPINEYPLFYVRFDDIKSILSQEFYMSSSSMGIKQNMLDVFLQRMFKTSGYDKGYTLVR